MSDYVHPFETGIRVALVDLVPGEKGQPGAGKFGVAMAGGRFVVPLPPEFDGRTEVFWVDGWIVVRHPDLPMDRALLADTTTGTTSPMNEHAMAAAMRAYSAPTLH